jgi:hypothetical protein
MTQATVDPTTSKFDNISDEMLADAIGHADLIVKAAEAELQALKNEFRRRGVISAVGARYTITRSDQVSSRLDVTAVKAFLGDAWRKFEAASIVTVLRVKATPHLAAAA